MNGLTFEESQDFLNLFAWELDLLFQISVEFGQDNISCDEFVLCGKLPSLALISPAPRATVPFAIRRRPHGVTHGRDPRRS